MAIDSRAIQNTLRQTLQDIRPAENLLTGFQAGQGLVQNQQNLLRGDLQNQALQTQVQQQAELAPLEQQVRGAQLQEMLDALGAPDVATAEQIAFNTSKLAQLPDDQVPEQINRMISNAQIAGRTTENLDELLSVYQQDPARGRELLNAGLQAFQQAGLLDPSGGRSGLASAKTEIFDNGTVINSLPDGTTQVSDPSGNLVTGDERVNVLQTARQEQIGFAGKKAKSTAVGTGEGRLQTEPELAATTDAAKAAIKLSTETFKRLEPIQSNIVNIDEAISLIDEGAATGPIISRLPSIRQSSIQLDNLQKKLGLDVISSTTFGALSEGEREFALSTALPQNLSGPDLKKWLQRKKATQQKLIDQLGEAATFLGTPGNTIADYIEIKKVEQLEEDDTTTPTRIKFDAQGNIIQ